MNTDPIHWPSFAFGCAAILLLEGVFFLGVVACWLSVARFGPAEPVDRSQGPGAE